MMDTHEAAIKTYNILQARKELKEMGQQAVENFHIDRVVKTRRRKYRDFYSKHRVY